MLDNLMLRKGLEEPGRNRTQGQAEKPQDAQRHLFQQQGHVFLARFARDNRSFQEKYHFVRLSVTPSPRTRRITE